jgi:hypothetical protein
MSKQIRRIVTGHDENDKSIIVEDALVTKIDNPLNIKDFGIMNLWTTTSSPAEINDHPDLNKTKIPLSPPKNGTVFRIIDSPPESSYLNELSKNNIPGLTEYLHGKKTGTQNTTANPFMHKTNSVDYAIVLFGEIYLVLEDSEILLKQGDVIIQRGTNHAWINRSDKICRMAFILIDGH